MIDYKKVDKKLYNPSKNGDLIHIPKMNFLSVSGKGDPNLADGEYKKSIELLYGVMYTLKMSYKTDYHIQGFQEFVVPPLEGFWWQTNLNGFDPSKKYLFEFISVLRLPNFIHKKDVDWAIEKISKKKKSDYSKVTIFTYDEGLVVQMLHIGPFSDEPETIDKMNKLVQESGYAIDLNDQRHHHEIYLSDPRKVTDEHLKTIIRHPIKKL